MYILFLRRALLLFSLLLHINAWGQIEAVDELWQKKLDTVSKVNVLKPDYLRINEGDALRIFDKQPNFGLYKDNYIIAGLPVNHGMNKHNSDAKFQISIRHRLTKSILPFNTFLMLVYTQKSFWNIFEKSFPFYDNNYNPGLHISKPIIIDNELKGLASLGFEHESNGRDSAASRSRNYFILNASYYFNVSFSAQAKLWAGWTSSDNSDLDKYIGYTSFILNYKSVNKRLWCSVLINPRRNFITYNTQVELNYKVSRNSNQFLFLQWYQGYGEGLLEYNKYTSMLRLGFCIKPPLRSIY
ncbi:phospholipase A [Odoribacter sp. OttesenSCG-928-G04]|nr:phospholipase A [Odoribacter sp. OttesenSCG-928-G04]